MFDAPAIPAPVDETALTHAIWAHCPYCGNNVHGAVFPLRIRQTFSVDWEKMRVDISGSVDTQPLKEHMQGVHPDRVKDESGVCT